MTREETKQAKRKKLRLEVGKYYETIDGTVYRCDEVFGRGFTAMQSGNRSITREAILREVRVEAVE